MDRRTYESLSLYGDSDSKRYHHFEKKSTLCIRKIIKKAEKKKAGGFVSVGFREKDLIK